MKFGGFRRVIAPFAEWHIARRYEANRLANIERNADLLKSLGLVSDAAAKVKSPKASKRSSTKRKSNGLGATPPARQSKRVRNLDVDGTKLAEPIQKTPTFAEEQAHEEAQQAPFVGVLGATDHTHDPEANSPEHQAQRRACASALTSKRGKQIKKRVNVGTLGGLRRLSLSEETSVFKLVPGRVYSGIVHPRTDVLAAIVGDRYGHVGISWGNTGKENQAVFHPHVRPVSDLMIGANNDNQILTCSYDGQLRNLDLHADMMHVVSTFDQPLTGLSRGGAADVIFASRNDGRMSQIDLRSRKSIVGEFVVHEKKVTQLQINPCIDHLLVTASNDGMVKVWDARKLTTGRAKAKPIAALPHGKGVTSACWSLGTGSRLLTACNDDLIRVFENPSSSPSGKAQKWVHNNHTVVASTLPSNCPIFSRCLMSKRLSNNCHIVTAGTMAHQFQSDIRTYF